MKRDGGAGIDRRGFLCGLAACGCVAAVGAAGCTIAEVYGQTGAGELAFDINSGDFAVLQTVGETFAVDIETDADPAAVLLVRNTEETIIALERICPHTFCDMKAPIGVWDQPAQQLICICHQSIFSNDGTLVSGPSPRSIAAYSVEFDATTGQGVVRIGGPEGDAMVQALTEHGP